MDRRLTLLTLMLPALLLAVCSAHAATPVPPATPLAVAGELEVGDEVPEEGEEELEESECEEATAEFKEGEVSGEERDEICHAEKEEKAKAERAAAAGILPEECVVRTFLPTAVAVASHSQLRLTIYYTAYEPTPATIDFGLGDSRLGTAKRQLGAQGVIHLRKHLGDSLSAKVQAAHRIAVQISVPEAAAHCARYFSSELTAKRASKRRITFAARHKRS